MTAVLCIGNAYLQVLAYYVIRLWKLLHKNHRLLIITLLHGLSAMFKNRYFVIKKLFHVPVLVMKYARTAQKINQPSGCVLILHDLFHCTHKKKLIRKNIKLILLKFILHLILLISVVETKFFQYGKIL